MSLFTSESWDEFLKFAKDFYFDLANVATKTAVQFGASGNPEVFREVLNKGPSFLELYKFWRTEVRNTHFAQKSPLPKPTD